MKESSAPPNSASQLAKLARISERKLKANRENAKKSTGPKTSRGKAFSCRNAVKYGLFVNYATDFEALNEDPRQYEEFLNELWDHYRPVGRAEEVEVERIVLCHWRLKRSWRCENTMNLVARRNSLGTELAEQREYCEEREKEEKAVIVHLQSAKKQIDDTGQVSEELKRQIFAIIPDLEGQWSALDNYAQKWIEQSGVVRRSLQANRRWCARTRDMYIVMYLMSWVEPLSQRRWTNVEEIAIGRHAIPNPEALDRILRYETTIDRYLNRAIERLNRLQRRRRGEFDLPAVRVHLS